MTVKPHINRDKLKKIVIRAGRKVNLEVDVKGEPPPEICWNLKGKKVCKAVIIILVIKKVNQRKLHCEENCSNPY